jgi:hypothetical protein
MSKKQRNKKLPVSSQRPVEELEKRDSRFGFKAMATTAALVRFSYPLPQTLAEILYGLGFEAAFIWCNQKQ